MVGRPRTPPRGRLLLVLNRRRTIARRGRRTISGLGTIARRGRGTESRLVRRPRCRAPVGAANKQDDYEDEDKQQGPDDEDGVGKLLHIQSMTDRLPGVRPHVSRLRKPRWPVAERRFRRCREWGPQP